MHFFILHCQKKKKLLRAINVSKFQNKFNKLFFLPKYEQKIATISSLGLAQNRAEIVNIFGEKVTL